ncbi:hypothetical protein D3C76_926250 [compost metagenome]
MGCFNPETSDIDFLVVIDQRLNKEAGRRIADSVVQLHDEMPNKQGIEFSIILLEHLNPFLYPTPFEFHYSEFHREKYRTDDNYLCGGFTDEDLASQFVVAYYRGKTLYGKSLKEICEPIDRKYYVESIYYDVKDATHNIFINPVYVVLNLCRVLYYLQEGVISSKKEGGEWGLKTLSQDFHITIRKCLDRYSGLEQEIELDQSQALQFADYMLKEITSNRELLLGGDNPANSRY